ncbi:MAG: hypothetical protein ACR2OV_11485 [Hyphomicrobiaceae bacterium]
MVNQILVVQDAFEIFGRGLIVTLGPLEGDYAGLCEITARLVLPYGDEKTATMRLEYAFQSPSPIEYRWTCILSGVTKSDVPIGTEVWVKG